MSDTFQLAVIAFILLGIFIAWRAGQANPEGTGRVVRRMASLEKELQGKASKEDVSEVQTDIAAVKAKVDAEHELNKRTFAAVTRIESFLIEKALKGD